MRRSALFSAISSAAAILILAAGCSDQTPTDVQIRPNTISAAKSTLGTQVTALQLPHTPGSYEAIIGPEGGTLSFGIGSIVFPAGAVAKRTRITANTNGLIAGVTFGPHGLQFPAGSEPNLSLSFSGSDAGSRRIGVVYVDGSFTLLEKLTSSSDVNANTVNARVRHFSQYVLAAE